MNIEKDMKRKRKNEHKEGTRGEKEDEYKYVVRGKH
jgi:hypothetical protein